MEGFCTKQRTDAGRCVSLESFCQWVVQFILSGLEDKQKPEAVVSIQKLLSKV